MELFVPHVFITIVGSSCTPVRSRSAARAAAVADPRHRSFFLAGKLVIFVLEW
jgi:hypothetical protein